MNKEELTEKAKELTIKNVTDGKSKYYSWGHYKGCVVGLEYNNKQIAELEETNTDLKQSLDWANERESENIKRIAELEAQIEKMKQDLDSARENANKQEQWEIYSVLNGIYNDNFEVITSVSN